MSHRDSYRHLLRYEGETTSAKTPSLEEFDQKLFDLLESVFVAGLGEIYEHLLPKEATLEVAQNKTFTFRGGRRATMKHALCLSRDYGVSVWAAADGRVYTETVIHAKYCEAALYTEQKDIKLEASITWPAFFRMNCQYPLKSGTLAMVRLDIIRFVRLAAKTRRISGMGDIVFPTKEEVIDALRQYPSAPRPTKAPTLLVSQPPPVLQAQASPEHHIQADPLGESFTPPQVPGPQFLADPYAQNIDFLELVHKTRPGEKYLPGISKYEEFTHRSGLKAELRVSPVLQPNSNAVPSPPILTMENHGLPHPGALPGPVLSLNSTLRVSPSEPSSMDFEDFYSAPARTQIFKYHCDPHHCTIERLTSAVGEKLMSYLPHLGEFQFDRLKPEEYLASRLLLGICRDDNSGTVYQLWAYLKPTSRTDIAAHIDYILGAPATEGVQRPPFSRIKEKKSATFGEVQHNLYTNKALLRPEFRDLYKRKDELQAMIKYAFVLGAEKLRSFMKDHHIPICKTHFTDPLERVCNKFEFEWVSEVPGSLPLQVTRLRTTNNSMQVGANALETGFIEQDDADADAVASIAEPSNNKKGKSKVKAQAARSPNTSHNAQQSNGRAKEPMKKVKDSRVNKSGASATPLNSGLLEALKESNRIRGQARVRADDREKAAQHREEELERLLTDSNRDRRQAEDDRRQAEEELDKMSAKMEQLFEQLEVHEATKHTRGEDGDVEMDDTQ